MMPGQVPSVRHKDGFTPIELAMVVILVSALAAVTLPRIIALRQDARKAVCQSDVRTIRAAVANWSARYRTEDNTCPVPGACSPAGYPLSSQFDDPQSVFSREYFPEGILPSAADITSSRGGKWSDHYDQSAGAIDIAACCP